MNRLLNLTLKQARRLVVAVVGGTVLIVGLVMIFFPGPAVFVIPAGLAILATEFAWARWLLNRIKERAGQLGEALKNANRREQASERPAQADQLVDSQHPGS